MSSTLSSKNIFLTQSSAPPSVPSDAISPMPTPPSWMDDTTPPANPFSCRAALSSSLPSHAYADFTKSPTPSVPSGIFSRTPPGTQPHNKVTRQNLRSLDGLSNPNISRTFCPHPLQLDRNFCKPNCKTFYVVTAGWEVGIFDNWGIAKTRVQSMKNNSQKSFSSWEEAVLYYTQCHMENCIEILDPVLPSPTLSHRKQQPLATPSAVPQTEVAQTPHGIGTQSRPITVLPSTVPVRQKSTRTRICRGKQKASDEKVITISSDSEGDDKSNPRPLTKPPAPSPTIPVAVRRRRRRILIIDDLSDEGIVSSDTSGNPRKKVKHFRMALHTMFVQPPEFRTSEDASAGHTQTVPLPVHLFDVSIRCSAPGVAAPPGTVLILSTGPKQHSEYEFSDIEPELLAALCKGT